MSAKTILVLCAQAFFIQTALSQCTSSAAIDASRFSSPCGIGGISQAFSGLSYDRMAGPGLAFNGYAGRGLPCDGYYSPAMEFAITSGGGLPVTSISSISPTGIKVRSDNAYEGPVIVTGELPFVSAVAMEGNLPTAGAGGIQYGCGNGVVAMLSEGPTPAAFGSIGPGVYAPGSNVAFGAGSGFGSGPALGLGNGFGAAAGFAPTAGFANANRLGYGGCGSCGRGMLY